MANGYFIAREPSAGKAWFSARAIPRGASQAALPARGDHRDDSNLTETAGLK